MMPISPGLSPTAISFGHQGRKDSIPSQKQRDRNKQESEAAIRRERQDKAAERKQGQS